MYKVPMMIKFKKKIHPYNTLYIIIIITTITIIYNIEAIYVGLIFDILL